MIMMHAIANGSADGFLLEAHKQEKKQKMWDTIRETPCPKCGEQGTGWLRICDEPVFPLFLKLYQGSCRSCGYKTRKHYAVELVNMEWKA